MKSISREDQPLTSLNDYAIVSAVFIADEAKESVHFETLPDTVEWADGTKASEYRPIRNAEDGAQGNYWLLQTVDGFLCCADDLFA